MTDLTVLREEIDGIDRELVALLERRMDVAAGVAAYKKAHDLPVLDASREAEKLSAIATLCRADTAKLIPDIFAAIMAASRGYQRALLERENDE